MTVYVDTCERCGYRHPKGDCAERLAAECDRVRHSAKESGAAVERMAAEREKLERERDEARKLARWWFQYFEPGVNSYDIPDWFQKHPWLKEGEDA